MPKFHFAACYIGRDKRMKRKRAKLREGERDNFLHRLMLCKALLRRRVISLEEVSVTNQRLISGTLRIDPNELQQKGTQTYYPLLIFRLIARVKYYY